MTVENNANPGSLWAPPQGPPLSINGPTVANGRALPPPRAEDRRSAGARAETVTDPRFRRLYGWETWVVLAIFPLGSTIAAIGYLLMHVITGGASSVATFIIAGEPGLSVGLSLALGASEFSAALLVIYLLVRNGEGVGAIGLGGHRLRQDLALLLPVYVGVQYLPQLVGASIVSGTHLPVFSVSSPALPVAFLAVGLLSSLMAGVVEEIVVLGYLVRRFEQRGWTSAAVVLVAVLVRVSYHLYYGPGVLPIVLWATVSVLAYRRIRRLLPFIVCHFVWDATIELHRYSAGGAGAFIGTFLAASLIFTLLWARKSPAPEVVMAPELSALS
jgi:membrane protease YdiL (CAAX protease family)